MKKCRYACKYISVICLLISVILFLSLTGSAYADTNRDYSDTPQSYTGYKTMEGSKKGLAVGAPSQAIDYQCDSLLFNLEYTQCVTTEDTGMFMYSYEGQNYYFDDWRVLPMRVSIQDYKASHGGQLVIMKMYSYSVIPGLTYQYKPSDSTCVSLDCEHYEDNIKVLFSYLGQYLGTCTDYWVIGNEIDAADNYNYAGGIENRTVEFYGKMYAYLMKDLYNVMVCYNGNVSLLISFDQGWNISSSDHYSTKELISVIQNKLSELGDFCWGLAPQCYNVAHVDITGRYATPIWWNDKTTWSSIVTESYDTPFIVLDNIDVLISYMKQDSMLYNGKIRPILITEIGFSSHNGGVEDEDSQVLAFERFHQMVMDTPEIITYIYNNQPDGGGVWLNITGRKLEQVFIDTVDDTNYTQIIKNSIRYGDVDADGQYTLVDIVYIRRHILGMQTLTGDAFEAADINGDGAVDLVDLVYIRGYLQGVRSEIPQR